MIHIVKRKTGRRLLDLRPRWKSAFHWFFRTGDIRLIYDHKYLLRKRKTLQRRFASQRRRKRYGSGVIMNTRRKRAKKKRLMEEQKGVCALCRQEMEESDKTLDHIIRIEDGGGCELENMQLIHRKCHDIKEEKYDRIKKNNGKVLVKEVSSKLDYANRR